MKQLSDWWANFLKRALKLLIVGLLLFLAFLLSRCNPELKIARDDQKAVDRVNAKAPLQEEVLNFVIKTHPPDTSKQVIVTPGKTIYVPVPQIIKDTTGRQRFIDSIKEAHENELDLGKVASDAYELGWNICDSSYRANPIKAICPPDTTIKITLTSEINRLNDSLQKRDVTIGNLQGQLVTQKSVDQKIISDLNSKITKLYWIITGLLALIGIVLFIGIRTALTKIPKLTLPKL